MSTETTELLRDSVIGACGELADTGWHPQAWAALEEIGVTALVVPEANGGAGATYADAAVVLPALGSLAASLPIVEVGLLAGWLMTLAGSQLPTGVVTAAMADDIDVQPSGDGWLLSGQVPRVPWARHADRVVILADYSKIGQRSRISYCPVDRIDVLVTNKKAAEAADFASLKKKLEEIVLA